MQRFFALTSHLRSISRAYSNAVNLNDKKFQNYLNHLKTEYDEFNASARSTDSGFKNIDRIEFLQKIINIRTSLVECQRNLKDLEDIMSTTTDKEFIEMAKIDINELIDKRNDLEENLVQNLIPPCDHENYQEIELSVTCGAGGEEAMLFAREIFHMYKNYASFKGWPFQILASNDSEYGGIKSALASISGSDAFQCLRFEGGVHRVQRVPVTEKSGRMHTSTCAVMISPQPSEIQISIPPKDVRVELKRSSGAGGQNVNMRETAVRIVHLPTNIAVDCQEEREQHTNYKKGMKRLRGILFERQFSAETSKLERNRKLQMGNRERSEKIRTYNYADNIITDHRTKEKFKNLKLVLNGGAEFDTIVQSLLNFNRFERLFELLEKFDNK